MIAVRVLDKTAATAALKLASALEEASEFWSAYAWVRSVQDLTWSGADYGLARFEAAVANHTRAAHSESLSEAMATRAQADLLCGAGRIYAARALLQLSANSRLNRYQLVSEARIHLTGQGGAGALRVAEEGVHDPATSLPARAHLHAIRGAALLLIGAEPALVKSALHAACTLCTEGANVLPFVFLPAGLRAGLLELHDQLDHGSPCILDVKLIRSRLEAVVENFESLPALVRLTPREKVLLPLLAGSGSVLDIAVGLHVSVNTVRKQVVTLREKLAAPDRASLVATAYELGLLTGRAAVRFSA
jgi:DNA-binding CsgD family transcriptional regulator